MRAAEVMAHQYMKKTRRALSVCRIELAAMAARTFHSRHASSIDGGKNAIRVSRRHCTAHAVRKTGRHLMHLRVAIFAFLFFGFSIPSAVAQNLLTITVTADKAKANGSPWDGPPGASNARMKVPQKNAAPDLAICVVEPGKPAKCEQREAVGRVLSKCRNAFQCKFERISVPAKPFGLVVLDLDLRRHDLVDFAIVVPDGHPQPSDVEAADIALRRVIESLAPSVRESEHQRRQKDIPILVINQCGNACRLTLSEIRFEAAK
jgi:hypothetical protein